MVIRWLRIAFHAVLVRPFVMLVFGLNVRHRDRLPGEGPAIVVANHNSHLDTLGLMSLFPLRQLPDVRPVAAMDYFMRNRALSWVSQKLIGIIPLDRDARSKGLDPLLEPGAALERGEILILFPEGTRGEAEELAEFKKGVSFLVERHPGVPVYPVFLHGFGKAWPKGDWLPVPFFLDVFVGEPVHWEGDRQDFMATLKDRVDALAGEGTLPDWS